MSTTPFRFFYRIYVLKHIKPHFYNFFLNPFFHQSSDYYFLRTLLPVICYMLRGSLSQYSFLILVLEWATPSTFFRFEAETTLECRMKDVLLIKSNEKLHAFWTGTLGHQESQNWSFTSGGMGIHFRFTSV